MVLAGQFAVADDINEFQTLLTAAFRVGDTAATSGTNLLTWATTNAINTPGNTVIRLEAEICWTNTVSGELFGIRIYDTNTSGSIVAQGVIEGLGAGPYNHFCSHAFTTDSDGDVGKVWMATIHRLTGGGTATVQENSVLRVIREGASGIYVTV